MTTNIFKNRRGLPSKLLTMGFDHRAGQYVFTQPLMAPTFTLTITITLPNTVTTRLIDNETQEPYTLHLAPHPTGKYVMQVRTATLAALQTIADQAFESDIFATDIARDLIAYVDQNYHNQLEFLWKKFPENAIWRRTDTKKWYAVLLKVTANKLGLPGDDQLTVLDLRLEPDQLATLVDHAHYFPGYHMNKNHWYTIILDGQVSLDELKQRLDHSYELAH